MIALSISGCCNGCEYIQLELNQERIEVTGHFYPKPSLCCIHAPVCGFLAEERSKHPMRPDKED